MPGPIGARSRPPGDPAALSSAGRAHRLEHRFYLAAWIAAAVENVLAGPIAASAAWTKFAAWVVS
jgi:hypothetical protein